MSGRRLEPLISFEYNKQDNCIFSSSPFRETPARNPTPSRRYLYTGKSPTRFYEPDITIYPDSPFLRDGSEKLFADSLGMNDRTLVMVMTQRIGANLINDEKRAHLIDLKREHLIDQVCPGSFASR
jgi:hypothetical protein